MAVRKQTKSGGKARSAGAGGARKAAAKKPASKKMKAPARKAAKPAAKKTAAKKPAAKTAPRGKPVSKAPVMSAGKSPAAKAPAGAAAAKKPAATAAMPRIGATATVTRPQTGTANGGGAAARTTGNGASTATIARPAPASVRSRYSVICVSRALGAGGEDIGRNVASALGFRYADDEIIIRASDQAGVSPDQVEAAEHKPKLIDRIMKVMARVPMDPEMRLGPAGAPSLSALGYERIIEQVVRETADEGDVVIVAHGGSIALGPRRDLLRVLVTASPSTRAARVARESGVSDREAERQVQQSDAERRDFLERFYRVKQEQPTHYDVVLNTDMLTPSQAAQIVIGATRG